MVTGTRYDDDKLTILVVPLRVSLVLGHSRVGFNEIAQARYVTGWSARDWLSFGVCVEAQISQRERGWVGQGGGRGGGVRGGRGGGARRVAGKGHLFVVVEPHQNSWQYLIAVPLAS